MPCLRWLIRFFSSSHSNPLMSAVFLKTVGAGRPFPHDNDRLLQALVVKLVEGDEHERPALAGGWRRLDEKVLLAPFLKGALLHGTHAERVRLRRTAGARIRDR